MKRLWRHVIVNTKSSWLHGDPRGFHSRDHRIHSSGDYKNPPPPDEHRMLHLYHLNRCGVPVSISAELRPIICAAFIRHMLNAGHDLEAVSVGETHLHALVHLFEDRAMTKREVGEAKRKASRAVKTQMPGSIWSEGGTYKPVNSNEHFVAARHYIRFLQEEDAFVWCKGEVIPKLA